MSIPAIPNLCRVSKPQRERRAPRRRTRRGGGTWATAQTDGSNEPGKQAGPWLHPRNARPNACADPFCALESRLLICACEQPHPFPADRRLPFDSPAHPIQRVGNAPVVEPDLFSELSQRQPPQPSRRQQHQVPPRIAVPNRKCPPPFPTQPLHRPLPIIEVPPLPHRPAPAHLPPHLLELLQNPLRKRFAAEHCTPDGPLPWPFFPLASLPNQLPQRQAVVSDLVRPPAASEPGADRIHRQPIGSLFQTQIRPARVPSIFCQSLPPGRELLTVRHQPASRRPRPGHGRLVQAQGSDPNRIQMDVATHLSDPLLGVGDLRLEAPLEQGPRAIVAPVEPDRIRHIEPLYRPAKVGLRGLDLQMIVIAHEHPRVHHNPEPPGQLRQQPQPPLPIPVVLEDRPPLQSPVQDVVVSSRQILSTHLLTHVFAVDLWKGSFPGKDPTHSPRWRGAEGK